mmetsp:Transcript_14144/g.27478  ORF Transcript_14144/g.27478 Transcript_14144/m.27478 type:complete len:252 (-) Transcript_14144:531-1286(-)
MAMSFSVVAWSRLRSSLVACASASSSSSIALSRSGISKNSASPRISCHSRDPTAGSEAGLVARMKLSRTLKCFGSWSMKMLPSSSNVRGSSVSSSVSWSSPLLPCGSHRTSSLSTLDEPERIVPSVVVNRVPPMLSLMIVLSPCSKVLWLVPITLEITSPTKPITPPLLGARSSGAGFSADSSSSAGGSSAGGSSAATSAGACASLVLDLVEARLLRRAPPEMLEATDLRLCRKDFLEARFSSATSLVVSC